MLVARVLTVPTGTVFVKNGREGTLCEHCMLACPFFPCKLFSKVLINLLSQVVTRIMSAIIKTNMHARTSSEMVMSGPTTPWVIEVQSWSVYFMWWRLWWAWLTFR